MGKPQRLCFRAVEFRSVDDGSSDGRTLEGYAAVFGSPTRISSWEGNFNETIERGAFAKTLTERKPVLQFDHGKDARTGSVPIGKFVELREDDKGLFVRARLFDNHAVEPIRQAIEGGAIDGMSFRFRVTRDEWRDSRGELIRDADLLDHLMDQDNPPSRTIREVELYEAGPVVFPAYAATSVGVRSLLTGLSDDETRELLEELLGRAAKKPAKKTPPPDSEEDDDEDDDEDAPVAKKKAAKKPAASGAYDKGLSAEARESFFRESVLRGKLIEPQD
jgi:uncharacterized protein